MDAIDLSYRLSPVAAADSKYLENLMKSSISPLACNTHPLLVFHGYSNMSDFVRIIYQPAHRNYNVLMNDESTDDWRKVANLAMGCKGVPLEMDANGLPADVLETTLREWDTSHPGVKRPHVL
ncbi:hypothetical protein DFS33DRAFT_1278733 [Desarmillaria ectypa]|nr:hypothetical protein DFS33DRAFT_1278733 [Desarmillaria ectypa]